MTTYVYVAKRELEKTGFTRTGIDISAAAADHSFNSVTTSLAGLLDQQWVNVFGFANAANNGWFQVNGASAAAKISQTTPPVAFIQLPGTAGNYASSPNAVANQITGDIEFIARVAPIAWGKGTDFQSIIAKWGGVGARSWVFYLDAAGKLGIATSSDGTATLTHVSSVAVTGGVPLFVKGALDVDNGAAGRTARFYTSADGITWTQLGTDIVTAGVTTIFAGTAGLEVGSEVGATTAFLVGSIYRAKVASSIGGAAVVDFDASRVTGVNDAVFGAVTGETWTINRSGSPAAEWNGSALVTAAAGPTVSITGYKRGLNQTYTIESNSERLDPTRKAKKTEHRPLGGGAKEVIFQRAERGMRVTTDIFAEAQARQYREFLASVEGGELFTFDAYGSIATPDNPQSVQLGDDGWNETRVGSAMLYRFSFEVEYV